jgi:hypothetical protein
MGLSRSPAGDSQQAEACLISDSVEVLRLGSTGALACAALEEHGALWIDESFDHPIRLPEAIYIAMNTVEIGVWSPHQYPGYCRREMKKPERKRKAKDPWFSGE